MFTVYITRHIDRTTNCDIVVIFVLFIC